MTSARWWCVRATRQRHSRGDGTMPTICTRQRDRNRVTTSGEVRTTRVCAHTTPGPKGQGLRSTVVCSACGCRRRAGTRRALVGTRSTRCKARCVHVAVGSGTCKRPARLDGQLSSDGGSAWRRGAGQRATHKQRAHMARSSLGSKAGFTTREGENSPRVPGHDGEAAVSRRGSEADAEQRMQNRAWRGSD
jgi:hypothetical protein